MTIIQLKYFIEVIKNNNNITKAAKKLYVSQPAVSKAIQDLEEEFNTSLFIRYNNQLVLTDEGYHLYNLAIKLINDYDEIKENMASYVNKTKILKIGIPPMLGSFIVSPIIKEYSIMHPDTEIQLIELGSVANRKALIDEDISLGLTILPLDGKIEKELEYIPIKKSTLLFSVSKNSPFNKYKSISFEEINNYPLILMKDDCLQSTVITDKFNSHNIEPNIKIRTNQIYTIRELLINNNLGAFIFNQILETDDKIIGIPLNEKIEMDIVVAYRKDKELNNLCKEFIDFAKNKLIS